MDALHDGNVNDTSVIHLRESAIEAAIMEPSLCTFEDQTDTDDVDEEDGTETNEFLNTLPRPPTKPNVPIEDETICPVCTQKGM